VTRGARRARQNNTRRVQIYGHHRGMVELNEVPDRAERDASEATQLRTCLLMVGRTPRPLRRPGAAAAVATEADRRPCDPTWPPLSDTLELEPAAATVGPARRALVAGVAPVWTRSESPGSSPASRHRALRQYRVAMLTGGARHATPRARAPGTVGSKKIVTKDGGSRPRSCRRASTPPLGPAAARARRYSL
jgi:hypothetical protein